jgi:hypothetical protein
MRQIRHTRRRPGPASEQQSPLPADPRDPDIVHAQQLAADHINEMIAEADDRRQARQARRAQL